MAKKKSRSRIVRRASVAVRRASRTVRRNSGAALSPMLGTMAAGAAAMGLGYVEEQRRQEGKEPLPTVGGLPPALVFGVAAALLPNMFGLRGKTGAAITCGGAGLVGAGAYQMGQDFARPDADATGEDDYIAGDDIVGEDRIV